jgi:hypothetical protein
LENEESFDKREEFPQGHNAYSDALSFDLFVRIVDNVSGDETKFAESNIKLNKIGTIFTVESHNDITSVSHSM